MKEQKRYIINASLFLSMIFFANLFYLIPVEKLRVEGVFRFPDIGFIIIVTSYILYVMVSGNKFLYNKLLSIFLIFVLFQFIRTVIVYDQSPYSTMKIARNYIYYFLFIPFVFYLRKGDNLEESVKFIVFITIIISSLYIFQFLTGKKIFFGHWIEEPIGNMIIKRNFGGLPPLLTFAFTYALISVLEDNKLSVKNMLMLITTGLCILFSFTRGLWLITFFIVLVVLFMYRKKRRLYTYLFSALFLLFIIGLFLTKYLNLIVNRATSAWNEYSEHRGTMHYRILLFKERFNITKENNLIWGVGFLHSDSAINFGLKCGYIINGAVPIRNADSSWATLIPELGLLGGLILLSFIYKLFQDGRNFIKYNYLWIQRNKKLKIVFYSALLQIPIALIGAFTSGSITHRPWSICFCMAIVYSIIYKGQKVKEDRLHEIPEI